MNLIKAIAIVLGVVWLQLALLPVIGPYGIVPNLALVVVVVLAARQPLTSSLAMTVAIGWLLDVGSGSDYGLRTAFYVLLALVTTSLRQFGSDLDHFSLMASVVAATTVMFNLAILANLALTHTSLPLGYIGLRIGIEIILNILLLLPLRSLAGSWGGRRSAGEPMVALRGRRG